MWKTFTDDCQFFDIFGGFPLSFIAFNFYFCITASEEKRKHRFQNIGIRQFSQFIINQQIKCQNYGDF
jgi:hypothetical protein